MRFILSVGGRTITGMDLRERAANAALSLSKYVMPLSFTDWSAVQVTAELTKRVVAWGIDHGWRVRREVPSLAELPGARPDRSGYLDVVCERLSAPPIVVEIDRTDKQWSSRKLLCEADAGAVAVWVRWADAKTWIVPDTIGVVRVPTTCRRAAGTGRRLYSRYMSESPPTGRVAPLPRSPVDTPQLPAAPADQQATGQCAAITKQGIPCSIAARPSGLCHVHDPEVQCGAVKKNGQPCTVATGGGCCAAHRQSVYVDAARMW